MKSRFFPGSFVFFGVILLIFGFIALFTGKAILSSDGIVFRSNDPVFFWIVVVLEFLFGGLAAGFGIWGLTGKPPASENQISNK